MIDFSNVAIPPLIILKRECAIPCVINRKIKLWFTSKAIRDSNAFVIHDPDNTLWNKYGAVFSLKNYTLKRLGLSDIKLCLSI